MRHHITLIAPVCGQLRTATLAVPPAQTVGWLLHRSGWLPQDPTLATAIPTAHGKPIPLTTPLSQLTQVAWLQPVHPQARSLLAKRRNPPQNAPR